MSCWREQHVLRMPATTIGIHTEEEWKAFYNKIIKETTWEAGDFAPALCSYRKTGPMIDYILVDSAPVEGGGYVASARMLWGQEMEEYLPIFQKQFPGFTIEQMEDVHYCEFKWYDSVEAPDCY